MHNFIDIIAKEISWFCRTIKAALLMRKMSLSSRPYLPSINPWLGYWRLSPSNWWWSQLDQFPSFFADPAPSSKLTRQFWLYSFLLPFIWNFISFYIEGEFIVTSIAELDAQWTMQLQLWDGARIPALDCPTGCMSLSYHPINETFNAKLYFYRARNSWDIYWGDKGYIYMHMGVNQNLLASNPSYPVV